MKIETVCSVTDKTVVVLIPPLHLHYLEKIASIPGIIGHEGVLRPVISQRIVTKKISWGEYDLLGVVIMSVTGLKNTGKFECILILNDKDFEVVIK